MTKKEYRGLLRRKEWKEKRLEILQRDGFECTKCKSKIRLEIHHKYYLEGYLPWEYKNNCYLTLCRKCHKKKHKGKPISSFIRTKKKAAPKSNKRR